MQIDKDKCVGCLLCHPYCTVGAISTVAWNGKTKSEVDRDQCVECGACIRSEICASGAMAFPELEWPRKVRAQFGNPYFHPKLIEGAPPAPELKINDLTGLIQPGTTEVVVEVGRPGISTSFRDVQTVCHAMVKAGVRLHAGTAVATIMDDLQSGTLRQDVIAERALNVLIHGSVADSRLQSTLDALREAAGDIDTVFSLSLAQRRSADPAALQAAASSAGFRIMPHTKTNVGLGRRLEGEERR
jgi:NAD-dependent dihydropyrimidine dehydrogenase PreA subunit